MQGWTIYYEGDNPNPIGIGYDTQVQHPNGEVNIIHNIVHYFNNNN